jgi:hypothetical protein
MSLAEFQGFRVKAGRKQKVARRLRAIQMGGWR